MFQIVPEFVSQNQVCILSVQHNVDISISSFKNDDGLKCTLLNNTILSFIMTTSSYYDIDAILAEEELIPCTTLFEFSHLAHLDPDARLGNKHYLPESSRIKMPLWAVEKWAMLGFVRLTLPRHFGRKARERLEADPGDADLRYVVFISDPDRIQKILRLTLLLFIFTLLS